MKEEKSDSSSGPRRMEAPKARPARPAPRTPLDEGNNSQIAETQELLNAILADEFVLYVRTLNCHWNVRGMQFHSLHDFFEKLYREQAQLIDDLAEKVRSVGGYAMATLEEYLGNTRLKEAVGPPADPRTMVAGLVEGHETVIKHVREAFHAIEDKFDDPATSNFLADLLESHEKTMWMLKTHLDRELG